MEWYWIVLIALGAAAVWLALSAVFYRRFFKRFYDLTLSLLALIVLSPLFLLLTVVGAIAMKGNPFFTQKRPGRIDKKTGKEKIFRLIKFRTMSNAKDGEGKLLPDEQRLNRYGKFLRSTSLDELPELVNIMKGDMSIVGPRPLLVEYLPWYTEAEKHRHDVRPGLTGLAQVSGRNHIDWDERFALDVEYVQTVSLGKDLKILFMTALKVLKRNDVAVNTADEGNMARIRKAEQEKENE